MVFPVGSVSFGVIAFSVRFEIVKLVDSNEIEPKDSSVVELIVSSFVVDVAVVEVVVPIVEFSLSVEVFFKSMILFMSGKIFIVAKNIVNKLAQAI